MYQGGGRRGGYGWGGGGGGQGCGQGGGGPSGRGRNTWDRKSNQDGEGKKEIAKEVPSAQESDKAKWDQAANKMGGNQVNEEIIDQNSQPEVNQGPELCAAQVEDQSFFFIEECIDPRVSKEKECIGVINVLQGHATTKQIEQ